jgi:hypothetical protein
VGPYITALAATDDYENPTPPLTLDPLAPLREAIAKIAPTSFLHWRVTTDPVANWQGQVTNVPFEQRRARVTAYSADYWLLSKDGGKSFGYFSYTQTSFCRLRSRAKPMCFRTSPAIRSRECPGADRLARRHCGLQPIRTANEYLLCS